MNLSLNSSIDKGNIQQRPMSGSGVGVKGMGVV